MEIGIDNDWSRFLACLRATVCSQAKVSATKWTTRSIVNLNQVQQNAP